MSAVQELEKVLRSMDVPAWKRENITDQSLQWLSKNLAIRNRTHKNFDLAIKLMLEINPKLKIIS